MTEKQFDELLATSWDTAQEAKIRADERQKLLAEIEGWLVDERLTVVAHKYGTETGEIESTVGDGEEEWKIPRNDLRAELRAKVKEMKGGK